MPRMCVEGELARGDLRELRIKQMRFKRKLYLAQRQRSPAHGRGARPGGHYSSAERSPGESEERPRATPACRGQLIQRRADARQPFAHVLRLSANSNAKCSASQSCPGTTLVSYSAQQLAESVGVAAVELRKCDRSRFRPDRQQVPAALEKFLQQRAIGSRALASRAPQSPADARNASTLSNSTGCGAITPNRSFSRHMRSASGFAAKIQPQRNP